MYGEEALVEIILYLGAALIMVPVARWLGIGSVLGYLLAGLIVGPPLLGLADDTERVLHIAEFGVVMLLFVIGLELQPRRLWVLRKAILVQGGAQVLLTTLVVGGAAAFLLDSLVAGVVVGFALSLSSTAFVLQTLAERKQLTTTPGRAAFGILLFQDLAIIPALAVLPLLAGEAIGAGLSWWQPVLAVAAVLVGGHYGLRPLLRVIASTGIHELFTAATLLLVLGTALLMVEVGLSPGLGAFLAGVLVADSEFRHQLETDIEPFKGLLLGLFFMAVGMSVDMQLLTSAPLLLLGIALGLLLAKVAVLWVLGRATGASGRDALSAALFLAQGGEFAFVLFGRPAAQELLGSAVIDILVLAVILSMAATPLLFALDAWLRRRGETVPDVPTEVPDDVEHQVVIAGFGRFGQIVGRLMSMTGYHFTAIDDDPSDVEFVRRFGHSVYYGDPRRVDVLRDAHVDRARLFVIAVDDVQKSIEIAEAMREAFPATPILARVRNRNHAFHMRDLGVKYVVRDTLLSAVETGGEALRVLGMDDGRVRRSTALFLEHDVRTLEEQYALHHEGEDLVQNAREAAAELRRLFEADAGAGVSTGALASTPGELQGD